VLTFDKQKAKNFAAYERLKEEIHRKHRGHYVAIADGRIIRVTDDFDEAVAAVENFEHHLVFKGGTEPDPVPVRLRGWLRISS